LSKNPSRGIIPENRFIFQKDVTMTSELKEPKKNKRGASDGPIDPIHVIREGTVAATISKRQSPSGYSYYDYSLSRSWKSLSSGKTGYSKNFFSRNQHDLFMVIEKATKWISEREVVAPENEVLAV
jgi:hypothetical protein